MAQLEFPFSRDTARRQHGRTVKEYAIALGAVLAGLGLQALLDANWEHEMAYLAFFPTVIFVVAYLGRGAALFALALSLVLANWFCIEPRYSLLEKDLLAWCAAAVFLVTGLALTSFANRSRIALARERRVAEMLEVRTTELSASEEINRRILGSIPDCVNMLGLDGTLLSINDAGRRLFEVTDASSWLRRNWLALWPEQHVEMVRQSIQQAAAGETVQFLAPCATARGRLRWWDVVLSPIYDSKGRPERLLAISRDSTERQESIARRLESEERRRLAMAATGDGVYDWDVANDRVTCNESFERDFQHGQPYNWQEWLNAMHPEDRERVQSSFSAALEGSARKWSGEYRYRGRDGRWNDLLDRAYIARDAEGRPRRVVGAVTNLTPLRKAEWRAGLLAETSSLLLRTDSPRAIVEALCQKVMESLGCEAFFSFLIDEDTGQLRLKACGGEFAKKLSQGQQVDWETLCGRVALNGRPVLAEHIQQSTKPEHSLARSLGLQACACNPLIVRGNTVGTLSFGTRSRPRFLPEEVKIMQAVADQVAIAIEREKTAAELRHANEELEKRVNERTQELVQTTEQLNSFCYSVAHDLRAPLRTQTGFARLLLDDHSERLDETGKHYLKAIMQAAERQSQIIQDLMAHVNVSRADLEMEGVLLEVAVQHAQADLEIELQQYQARLEVMRLENKPVLANRSSLHLVLLNLLSNACKFVPHGTKPVVRLRSERRDDKVRLWIEDNGIGIAPEDQKRLFGMFQRLRKGDYPGTGMGLAIVKTAVERMGGSVGIESEENKGSRFWVELKCVTPPANCGTVQLLS